MLRLLAINDEHFRRALGKRRAGAAVSEDTGGGPHLGTGPVSRGDLTAVDAVAHGQRVSTRWTQTRLTAMWSGIVLARRLRPRDGRVDVVFTDEVENAGFSEVFDYRALEPGEHEGDRLLLAVIRSGSIKESIPVASTWLRPSASNTNQWTGVGAPAIGFPDAGTGRS